MPAGIRAAWWGHYPRGKKALRGPFARFATGDAVAWFADHGLELVEEPDGRLFPSTNSSASVVALLRQAARILFLEGGRLIADGRHSDLVLTCPEYADAYHRWEVKEEAGAGRAGEG